MRLNQTIITGVIYKINQTEKYGDFEKRTFWVQELNVKYPNTWQLEMWHDDVLILNGYKINDVVQCQATVRGKIWENKITSAESVINIIKCDQIVRI